MPDRLNAGLDTLNRWGFRTEVFAGALKPVRNLAASDETRLAHFVRAMSDPSYDAVWAIRGGYGVTRFLDQIPWHTLTAKPVIGFSDLTPLLDQVVTRLGATAIHGPVVHSLSGTSPESLAWLRDLLAGKRLPPLTGAAWVPGHAAGPVVGGNLCLLAATCGTAAQLDARGCLLVLEDVGEPAYRIDRMLQQLSLAGVFTGVLGVCLGTFTNCAAPDGEGWDVEDVLRAHLANLGVPVLADLPIGHGPENYAFAVRGLGRIDGGRLTFG